MTERKPIRVIYISTYIPQKCGIATFTKDVTDAINLLIKGGFPVYGCEIKNGKYYDTGNKVEYLKTVIEFAVSHPDFAKDLKEYLKSLNL